VTGDFFSEVPSADLYLLKMIGTIGEPSFAALLDMNMLASFQLAAIRGGAVR
jgi:hypothetical protein